MLRADISRNVIRETSGNETYKTELSFNQGCETLAQGYRIKPDLENILSIFRISQGTANLHCDPISSSMDKDWLWT